MKYYPAFLNLRDRHCLVVGGGRVAERKVTGLLRAGCRVTVWSPELTPKLSKLAGDRAILHRKGPYQNGSLRSYALVVAATDDPPTQRAVAEGAKKDGVLVNVVDRPELCSFIAPSSVERGDLVIAVSTGGASPGLAKRIRRQLQGIYGREYGLLLRVLSRLRVKLPCDPRSKQKRGRILSRVTELPLAEEIKGGRLQEVDRLLTAALGPGFTMRELGFHVKGSKPSSHPLPGGEGGMRPGEGLSSKVQKFKGSKVQKF
jgi:precorrin-2 dehydrogenase/sirohydrochlorin ferrochelatase